MSETQDVAEWARAHEACFEAETLVEMQGSEKVSSGFVLNLYARLPTDQPPGDERRKAAAALWQRLRDVLESALSGEHGGARVEVEPMRSAAVLRPGNEMAPEITLRARIQHREGLQAVTPAQREGLSAFEKKLVAMGLRAGHW